MTTIRPASVRDADQLARLRWDFRIEVNSTSFYRRAGFGREDAPLLLPLEGD